MVEKNRSNLDGFIIVLPMLVIGAAVLILSLTFKYSQEQGGTGGSQLNVLSESDDADSEAESNDEDEIVETPEAKVEDEDGESEENEDENEKEDINEVEEEIEVENSRGENTSTKVKIKNKNGEFEIETEGITANSQFPISVNSVTNELVVTTSGGKKVVTVLPDQVLNNMLLNGIIDTSSRLQIQENENEIEYQIEGFDDQKLLGLFKIGIKRKIHISAESGQILSQDQSVITRLLDLLSV